MYKMKKNKYNNNMSKKNSFSSKSKLAKIIGLSAGAVAITTVAAGTITAVMPSTMAYRAEYGITCDSTYQKIIYGSTANFSLNLRDKTGGTPSVTDIKWSTFGSVLSDNSNAYFISPTSTSASLTTVANLAKGVYTTTVVCEFKISGVPYRTERTFTTAVVENVLPQIAIGGQTSSTYEGMSGLFGINYDNYATASLAGGSISGITWKIQSDASALNLDINSSTGVISFAPSSGFAWDPSMAGTYSVKIIASKDNYLDSTFETTLTISLNDGSRIYNGYMSSEQHGTAYTSPYGSWESAGYASSSIKSNTNHIYQANVSGGTWSISGFSGSQVWISSNASDNTCEFYWGKYDAGTIVDSTNAGAYTGSLIYSVPGYKDAVTDITLNVTGQALPNPSADEDITIQYGVGNSSYSIGNLCALTNVDVHGYTLQFKIVNTTSFDAENATWLNLTATTSSATDTSLNSYSANMTIRNDGVVSECPSIGEYDFGIIFTALDNATGSVVAPNVVPSAVKNIHLKVAGIESRSLVGASLLNLITSYHYNKALATISTPESCPTMATAGDGTWSLSNTTSSEIASLGDEYSSYTPVPGIVWNGNGSTTQNFSLEADAYAPGSSIATASLKMKASYAIPDAYGDASVPSWVVKAKWVSVTHEPQTMYIVIDPRNYTPDHINGIGGEGTKIQTILGNYDSTDITLFGESDGETENITNATGYTWDVIDSAGESVTGTGGLFGIDNNLDKETKTLWWVSNVSSESGDLRDQYGEHYKIKVSKNDGSHEFTQEIYMNLGQGQITKLAGTNGASKPYTDNWNASYSWTLIATAGLPDDFNTLTNHWAISSVTKNGTPLSSAAWSNNFSVGAGEMAGGQFIAPFQITSTTTNKLDVGRYVISFTSELDNVVPLASTETFTLIIDENTHPDAMIKNSTNQVVGTDLTTSWTIQTNTASATNQQYGINISNSTETSIFGGNWDITDVAINGTSWTTPYGAQAYQSSNYIAVNTVSASPSSFYNLTIDIRGLGASASTIPDLPAGTHVSATITYKQNNWTQISLPISFDVMASDYAWGNISSGEYLYNNVYQGSNATGDFNKIASGGSITELYKHALPDGTTDTTNTFKFLVQNGTSSLFTSDHFQLLTQTNGIVTGNDDTSGFWLTTTYNGWDADVSSSSVSVTIHWSQENVIPGTYIYKIHWGDTVTDPTTVVNAGVNYFSVDVPVSINIQGRTALNTLVHSDSASDTTSMINMLDYELGFEDNSSVPGTDPAVADFVKQLVNQNSNRVAANQNSLTNDVIAHLTSSTTIYTTTISSGIGVTTVKLGLDDSLYYNGINRGATHDTSSYAFKFNWDATDYNSWDITNTSAPSPTGTVDWTGLNTTSSTTYTSVSVIRKSFNSSNCPTGLTPGVEYAYLTNVANSSLSSTNSSSIAADFTLRSADGTVKFPRYVNTANGRKLLVGWTAGQTLDKQTPYRGFLGSASTAKITLTDDFIDMTDSFICTSPSSQSPGAENYLPIIWSHINADEVLMQGVRNAGTFFAKYASSVDLNRCGLNSLVNGDGFKFWFIQANATASVVSEHKVLCGLARTTNVMYDTSPLVLADSLPNITNVAQMAVDGSIASFNDGANDLYFNKFTQLTLPPTLQRMQEKSFANNTNLNTLNFNNMSKLIAINYDNLQSTGSFANCMGLVSIYFPNTAWLGYYGFGQYTFPTGFTTTTGASRKCSLYVGENWTTANADGSRPTWRASAYVFGGGLNNSDVTPSDSTIPLYTFSSSNGGYVIGTW